MGKMIIVMFFMKQSSNVFPADVKVTFKEFGTAKPPALTI